MNGKITISKVRHYGSADGEWVNLQVKDEVSKTTFVEIALSLESFAQALLGQGLTPCQLTTHNLDRVGKVRQVKTIEFRLDDVCEYLRFTGTMQAIAIKEAKRLTPKGWIVNLSFSSQDSFFRKGDEEWARTTIYRWVNEDESAELN